MKNLSLNGPKTPGYIVYGLPRCFEVRASQWFNRPDPVIYGFFPGTPDEEAMCQAVRDHAAIDAHEFREGTDCDTPPRLTARELGVGRFA